MYCESADSEQSPPTLTISIAGFTVSLVINIIVISALRLRRRDMQISTLCYKDGPELPPLNFTTTCPEYGRYVIFYNERLDRVIYPDGYELTNAYTELCEVIVEECPYGNFGMDCKELCAGHCLNNETCDHVSGLCLNGCHDGYIGKYCNICM
uniref:Scavenger receptor class F member 2 n=1 Tax=Magallana gigas TaxID=29159 RepID=K1QG44_MAGGI